MSDQYKDAQERFAKIFLANETSLNGLREQPLHQLRKRALARMDEVSFPDRKNENWKYTAVKPILSPDYELIKEEGTESNLTENSEKIQLEFINGRLANEVKGMQLPAGLKIESLNDAVNGAHGHKILERLEAIISKPKNGFELMNLAFAQNALFISVEKNTRIDKKIVVNYNTDTTQEAHFNHPQLYFYIAEGAELSVIENFEDQSSGVGFTNAMHIAIVGENAKFSQYKFQSEVDTNNHLYQYHISQKANSQFYSYVLDIGAKMVRNNLNTHLEGSNTETYLFGNYIANGRQSIDNQTFIDHALPHCYSKELYKGIVNDRAKAVFNGQVLVRQDAQKTNAFQQNASLVLSPNAIVDAKPQLEIYADDVKCSHGATIGQLDDESIFYLRSRGLSLQESKEMLQMAFVNEVVDHIKDEELAAKASTMIEEKLAG